MDWPTVTVLPEGGNAVDAPPGVCGADTLKLFSWHSAATLGVGVAVDRAAAALCTDVGELVGRTLAVATAPPDC